ncbi:hypothetical protein H634G_09718 [Metarhizium anisopliae BRIP 53293]|uniref:Heat-labile enterotoxin IIA, A chain n=1 Tax=Metarhizium anisopliae BRIP 53293 TaxID=1291518 RepID=A0A0D9NMW5_METAN|nr:hypothetical protein H634G_09718 [Metarhizium anisopliae BRIP 53293]KJK87574.1 hypothetical protein H633G_08567 [Metarhizium anisopliae BRIP 53284]
MKLSIPCLGLLGLASAHVAIVNRAPPGPPYKETPPSKLLSDAVRAGIPGWGLAGLPKLPQGGPKPPIDNMPGGLPELHRPKLGSSDWRTDTLKGPRKKPGTTYPKGPPCLKRGLSCRLRVPKAIGKAAAFMIVAPYARDILEMVKAWDNPIGHAVTWFDDAMASLQEAIGGPQRDDIYGNELKYKLIQFFKSVFRLFGETQWDMNERLREEAQAKEKARREEEERENQRIKGLEELAGVCEKMYNEELDGAMVTTQLKESCNKLVEELEKVESMEEEEEETVPERYVWFGKCRCNLFDLPPSGDECTLQCRVVSIILSLNPPGQDFESAPETPPEPEPIDICSNSVGDFECGSGQTVLELKTGRAVCGGCGFAWDAEGGRCVSKTGEVLWPLESPEPPDTPPEPVTGDQSIEDLWTGLTVCSICRGGWDAESSTCVTKAGELLWPRKLPPNSPASIPPEISGTCADSSGEIQCGGGQSAAELQAGYAICGVCGFAWDPEGGKCVSAAGTRIWPPPEPEPPRSCFDSAGEIECGGGQTDEELEAGYTACRICGGAWDPEGGKCSSLTGTVFWPPAR